MDTSGFERHLRMTGPLLVVAAVVLAIANESVGGPARALALMGYGTLAVYALSRGVRLYRAGAAASMPASVARIRVRVRPRRISTIATAGFALGLPVAVCAVPLALLEWAWVPMAGALLLGGVALVVRALTEKAGDRTYTRDAPHAVSVLLERLCMRADVPVPEVVVEGAVMANAWTTAGRIHLSPALLDLLDESELEAVLAHELAHLAHRDAATMDVCSSPSRMLLGFVGLAVSGIGGWVRHALDGELIGGWLIALVAALCVPPAFMLGWISRLSVLGMSRTREFAADAAAATLTGRPSALASALMKMDRDSALLPRADLREAHARAMLCILGTDRSMLGRLFCTHPPTATRIKRLEELEERLQAGGRAIRLDD
jgi:heat shock protein HtpX